MRKNADIAKDNGIMTLILQTCRSLALSKKKKECYCEYCSFQEKERMVYFFLRSVLFKYSKYPHVKLKERSDAWYSYNILLISNQQLNWA
jgi:hypothetical protein